MTSRSSAAHVASRMVLLALACVLATPATTGAALAQVRAPAERDALDLTVSALSAVIVPGGELRVELEVRNDGSSDARDLRVAVAVHRRVTSRFAYHQAVDEGRLGRVFALSAVEIDELAAGASHRVTLVKSDAELGFARPHDKFGVYPLRFELEDGGEVVDEVRSALVLTPAEVSEPVHVALVWPLDAPPSLLPDGSYRRDPLLSDVARDGRLRALVAAADAHPDVPLTIAPTGLLLAQAADLADGARVRTAAGDIDDLGPSSRAAREATAFLAQLRDVAARPNTQLLALGYGPADLVALVRGGMHSAAARDLTLGRETVENIAGARPQRGVLWPPDALNAATLTELLAAGVDTLLLSEQQLQIPADRDLRFSPDAVRRVRTGAGGTLTAVVADPWLEGTLAQTPGDRGPAVAAQRILAETAAVYFERPNTTRPRGLVLAPPQVWRPGTRMPPALLDAIAGAPWLVPQTLAGLVQAVGPDRDVLQLSYPAAARGRELTQEYVADLEDARAALRALAQVLVGEAAVAARFDQLLLAAASVHYRDGGSARVGPRQGEALIRAVRRGVSDIYGALEVVEGVPVTLTSIHGQVPVTIRNTSAFPLAVRVRAASPRYRFPGGDSQELVLSAREETTVVWSVEALTPGGIYPIRVLVEDPTGTVLLASGTTIVRSSAYSVTALVLTGGAAVFLLLWWVQDARRRRRVRAAQRQEPRRRRAARV